ncbi:MAG: hypothetical protein IPP71_20710 [Bacteroidetes bacterium]|nr:hypothetical protein [Bacteroidota bacterium]
MNIKVNNKLSDTDRKYLAEIEENYRLGEKIFGSEPLVYYQFNLSAPDNNEGNSDLELRRKDVFSNESLSFAQAKN